MPFSETDTLIGTKGSSFSGNDFEVDTPFPGLYEGMEDKTEISKTANNVFNLSSELGLPLDIVEFNYSEMTEIVDPDDVPEPEEPEEERPLEFKAAPEEKSLLKSIFGYEGIAKPEYYWNMNPIKRAAFDVYMAGRHIGTRIGGKIVTEAGIANTKEVHDLYNDELVNNPRWYQKSPELLGWGTEKAAEFYALKGLFKITGISKVLSTAGTVLAKPFLMKEIVARGGAQSLKLLSKEGLKRLGKDSLVAFLKFAPGNTAFLTTWSVAGAALRDEDKTEAAWSGALWGAGLSVVAPIAGGIGKVFLATKAGAAIRMAANRAYTELWRKFPRLMNAGKRPFSEEFLAETKRQFRARFGVEPTAGETAKLKKITRLVGDEITKAAEREAALKVYWSSGAKKAQEAAKEAVEVAKKAAEIVKKPPVKPVVPVTVPKDIKVPPKPAGAEITKEEEYFIDLLKDERQRLINEIAEFEGVKVGKIPVLNIKEQKRRIAEIDKDLEFRQKQVAPPTAQAKLGAIVKIGKVAEGIEPVPPQEPTLGVREAGGTTIIPDITTEASETGKRLGSTLKGAIKGARELASRNVLRYTSHLKGLGKEGVQVSKDFDEITQRAQKRINNNTLDAQEILKGVNKENREKIAKTINKRLEKPPKWIQQRADRLRKVLDELLDEAMKLGVQRRVGGIRMAIAGTGKAFPQVLNADGEKLLRQAGRDGINSPDVLEVAQEAVDAGLAKSVEEYVTALQHFREEQLRGVSGYLERERIELPDRFLEWDPDRVLSSLFQRNWLFVEGVRQWGVDNAGLSFPKLAVQIENIRNIHGSDEAKLLDQFVKASFGRELLSSEASRKISRIVRGYQFLAKIAASPFTITRNMLDRFNKVASFAPLSVQLKTLIEYPPLINAFLKHSKEIEEEMIRRGAVFSNTAIGEGYEPGHLLTKLAGKAFAASERGNQIYIALAKKNAIDANLKLLVQNPKIARIFDKRIGKLLSPLEALGKSPSQALIRLRELGNEEMLAKIQSVDDISPDLLDAILHKTVRDNAFPVVLSTKRSWWDNKPFVRMLTQFKVWGTDQIGHVWNDVIKDTVKHRDPSKMIGWLVSMAITGEVYNILRDFILGKDESLLKTLSDAERRNARDISITILKDMIDGGAIGIISDIIYGLPNLIGGPSAQTLTNIGDTTAKVIWNVSQAKDAIKQLAIKETPALRQTQAVFDKIDARFNQNNLTQDYYKWRRRAWEWAHKKKFPKLGDKAKEAAVKSLLGWTKRVPQERTLSYEMITRNILVGDTETASEFLFFLLRSAETPQEQESIERGIQTALRSASPLGNVAEDDLGVFFQSMTSERQREAISLQLQWNVNASEANSKAISKWQEWDREQR